MKTEARVLWRRLDVPGHEYAELRGENGPWLLSGTALFEHEKQPCRLDYRITCDEAWSTLSANVSGQVGDRRIDVRIVRRDDGGWSVNEQPCIAVAGCTDIDLNFSPSTNLLPIRRLNLAIGETAAVRAAWLRFPSFALEPLEQSYHRLGERLFRYESAGGRFVAELEVSDSGLPLRYGQIWSAESDQPLQSTEVRL